MRASNHFIRLFVCLVFYIGYWTTSTQNATKVISRCSAAADDFLALCSVSSMSYCSIHSEQWTQKPEEYPFIILDRLTRDAVCSAAISIFELKAKLLSWHWRQKNDESKKRKRRRFKAMRIAGKQQGFSSIIISCPQTLPHWNEHLNIAKPTQKEWLKITTSDGSLQHECSPWQTIIMFEYWKMFLFTLVDSSTSEI